MKKEPKTNRLQNLLEFIDRSPTPFHAVQEMACTLSEKGFKKLNETDAWELV
ncbi:MAG TPA: M18 family aminopeptidase, partial [Nitrospinaceae bacterium]|nr:M18 family aminopeptidase [Nitrospinaceae bacterium]